MAASSAQRPICDAAASGIEMDCIAAIPSNALITKDAVAVVVIDHASSRAKPETIFRVGGLRASSGYYLRGFPSG